jgi:hypothetical protein
LILSFSKRLEPETGLPPLSGTSCSRRRRRHDCWADECPATFISAEPNIKVHQVAARSLRFREFYIHHIRARWPSCLDSTGMFFAEY